MSFWTQALPYAQQAHAQTKVLASVVMAQWADENGYHWPPPGNNPGNVGNPDHGGQTNYATIQEGVNAYIKTMNLGYYTAVRNAVGYVDQSHALGQSPWAAGHYDASGPPPGQDLIKIIEANNLTQYDGATPAPPPKPPVQEADVLIAGTPSGGYWLVTPDGAVYAYGDAVYAKGLNNAGPNGASALEPGDTITGFAGHLNTGYWITTAHKHVYAFGSASYLGGPA